MERWMDHRLSLSFDVPDGTKLRDFPGDAGFLDGLYDFGDVLVGEPGFFGETGHRHGFDQNATPFHLLLQLLATNLFFGLRTRHRPSGAMHRGPERVPSGPIRSNQQVGTGLHRPPADDRLSGLLKLLWQLRTPRADRKS